MRKRSLMMLVLAFGSLGAPTAFADIAPYPHPRPRPQPSPQPPQPAEQTEQQGQQQSESSAQQGGKPAPQSKTSGQ